MRVKKYTGLSSFEVMTRIKKELGSEAIVLNTRTVRQKGFFGIFKKPLVEITAACDKKDVKALISEERNSFYNISKELKTLKSMVEKITDGGNKKGQGLSAELDSYRIKLIENGVEPDVAISILKKIDEQVNISGKDNSTVNEIIRHTLMEYIGQVKPLSMEESKQKFIFFIGPTGVGKTTTLAKITTQVVVEGKYDIGLITSDTYRIAAIEQLKTYSDILKLPLEVIYDEADMYKALTYYKDKDIVFIDTAGRNHKYIDREDKIFKIMDSIKNKEVYLLISNTTEYNTLKSIISQYSFINDYKIIFSKIDESDSLGNILNVKYLTKNSVSYITTGQNVPEDIEILDRKKVVNSLIGEISYE